jgi:hypothetical protein
MIQSQDVQYIFLSTIASAPGKLLNLSEGNDVGWGPNHVDSEHFYKVEVLKS